MLLLVIKNLSYSQCVFQTTPHWFAWFLKPLSVLPGHALVAALQAYVQEHFCGAMHYKTLLHYLSAPADHPRSVAASQAFLHFEQNAKGNAYHKDSSHSRDLF